MAAKKETVNAAVIIEASDVCGLVCGLEPGDLEN